MRLCDAEILIVLHQHHHHHQSVLPEGRSLTAKAGTKVAVLCKGRSSTANSGTKAVVLLRMDRCGTFPLLSASHSLFSIWTDLKRSKKIPGAAAWKWREWIWLSGPSELRRNSPHGLNISSIRYLTRSQIRKSQSPFVPILVQSVKKINSWMCQKVSYKWLC